MSENDWNYWYTDEIRELKKNLLNKLDIQSVDETSLQQLLKEIQDKQKKSEKSMHQLFEIIQKLQPTS